MATRLLVSNPTTGWVHKHCVFKLLEFKADPRYDVTIMLPTHRPFENNLHHIAREFVEGDWDYWLSFDADNPPFGNPLELCELGLDFVGCPTPVYHYDTSRPGQRGERPMYLNAYEYVPEKDAWGEWKDKRGLQEVDAVGTGCFMASREIITKMMDLYRGSDGIFARTTDEWGRVEKGNDLAFCERAQIAGFKIHAHFDYLCRHFHELELLETHRAYMEME